MTYRYILPEVLAFIIRLPRTWQTTAFQSLTWPVNDIFVMPGVITSLCLDTVSARMSVGHLLLPAKLHRTQLELNDLCDPTLSIDSFRRLLKTLLFSEFSLETETLHKNTTILWWFSKAVGVLCMQWNVHKNPTRERDSPSVGQNYRPTGTLQQSTQTFQRLCRRQVNLIKQNPMSSCQSRHQHALHARSF